MTDDLISAAYRAQQARLHESNPDYGTASVSFAPLVANLMRQNRITRLLDYGAGEGRLVQTLDQLLTFPFTAVHYDPAIPEWSKAAPRRISSAASTCSSTSSRTGSTSCSTT